MEILGNLGIRSRECALARLSTACGMTADRALLPGLHWFSISWSSSFVYLCHVLDGDSRERLEGPGLPRWNFRRLEFWLACCRACWAIPTTCLGSYREMDSGRA